MSGHSKWSTIKRKKGAIDAERSKIFQKLAKELFVAAKSGDPDPANNPSLRMVIDKAKSANMPNNNIERAIEKAKGSKDGEAYEQVRYEGYGPFGVAIMIDCLTDNRNRTAPQIRSAFTKKNGNLGTDGSVSYMFERKGLLVIDNILDEDKVMEAVLEAGALDFKVDEETYEIITSTDNFFDVKSALEGIGVSSFIASEITFLPNNLVSLDDEQTEKVMSLIETLEDIDDVQEVYHNLDI